MWSVDISDDGEIESLNSLKRVYAKKNIQKGQYFQRADVFFAMPFTGNLPRPWCEGIIAQLISLKINLLELMQFKCRRT